MVILDKLRGALARNADETAKSAGATVMLVNALNSTLQAQAQLSQSMVAVGRANEVGAAVFTMAAMNMAQQTKILTQINSESVRTSRDSIKSALNNAALLGKNTQSMIQLTAFNEQALGFTASQNQALMESSLTLASDFGVNSDKLISAIQSLSKTLISSAATYGKATSEALQQATMTMTAQLGTGASVLINEVVSKAAAGTRDAGLLAARLGVSLEAFRGNDPQAIQTTIETIISRAGDILLPLRQAGMPEFAMQPIMESFGLSPAFVILAERLQTVTEAQRQSSMEQLEAEITSRNLNTSLASAQLEIQKAFLPALLVLANLVKSIVSSPFAKALMTAMSKIIVGLGGLAILLGAVAIGLLALKVVFTPMLLLVAGLLALFGAGVDFALKGNEDREELLEETKKQNDILSNQNQQVDLLGQLNTQIIASQAIQQAQVDLLQQIEQKETTVNVGETLSIHDSFVQPNRVAGMGGK